MPSPNSGHLCVVLFLWQKQIRASEDHKHYAATIYRFPEN